MRLKHRLSLALTVVTTTALASSFGVGYFLVYREEMRDLDQAVLAQARVAAFLVAKRDPAHPRVEDGLVDDPEIPAPTKRYVAVYAPTGEILSSTRSFGAQVPSLASLNIPESLEPEGAVRDLEIAKERLRGVVLPLADRRGRLLYAVSRHTVDEDLLFLFQVFLALMLGATALTALFARWLGSRLSADVDAIASVAREVASGNLRARVGRGARGSTETQALGSDLDQMVAELDRLMAAQQTFVSHAAHELRSPLATVRGELQLALRRPRSAEEYKASIEDALTEVEELISLAQDLLVLARVQRAPHEDATTELRSAMSEAIRLAAPAAAEHHVTVTSDAPPEARVRGQRGDLARAVRNLIDNAIEHTPEGGTVQVKFEEGDTVRVVVDDAGPGVANEDAPHVFSPFYRGAKDRSGDARGTGLGLAIAREIARAYDGDVTLVDKQEPGARFVVSLARAAPGPEPPSRLS